MPFLVLADPKWPSPGERPHFLGNSGPAFLNYKAGKLAMKFSARRGIADGVAAMLILLFLGSLASAQIPKPDQTPKSSSLLKNIDLCNGVDRTSPEPQIRGCTAIINSGDLKKNGVATAYNNRGDAYAARGDNDLALLDYDQSIKENPAYAKPYNNRGVARLRKGEYDKALEDLNEAISLDPKFASAFANRAATYQKKNDFDRAERDYDEALRLNPDLKAIWSARCWNRAILGELQAALADCNKALQIQPNVAAPHDSRGLVYLKMGQFDSAIDDYN